jgi:ABC-type transport system involved in cytochrome c biogenesis permease component
MAHQDSQTIVSPAPLGGSTPVHTLPAGASLGTPSLWLSVGTLWLREIRSFYRQRSRVIGGLATPLVFWLLLGSGFGTSLRVSSGAGYLEFFFPGTLALVILFTAIFSNISVIEDRREGFLLSVLVAPVSRLALVLGKILGATTIGVLQGLLLLPLAPLAGLPLDVARLPALVGCMVLVAFGLTGLGFFFAWWLNSVQGFHEADKILKAMSAYLGGTKAFSMNADIDTYRKFKGHFSAGPSGAQPAKRPLEYPGSGKVAVVFTPRQHGMSQQPRLACRVPHARDWRKAPNSLRSRSEVPHGADPR